MKILGNTARMLAALAVAFSTIPAAQAQLKIGHIAPMTGPFATLGIEQYDGFMLRVAEGNGMLGGQKVDVVRTDSQGKPESGLLAARELVEREKVDMVVGLTVSSVINAVFPYIVDKEIPLVGTNGGPSPFAGEKCSPWFVSTAFQNDGYHEAAGQEAHERQYKKVAAIVPNYQAGKDAIVGFKRFYKAELVEEVYPALGQNDFSAEISQLAAAKPDIIYAFLPGAMGINFIKQYAQAGMMGKIPLLSSATVDDMTLPGIRDAAVGSMSSAYWVSGSSNPASVKFVQAFKEKYQRTPSNYAMQGYDAATLIDQVLKENPATAQDKQAFIKAARAATVDSPRGTLTFGRNGFPIQDYSIWKVVKQGDGVGFEKQNVALAAHQDAYVGQCPLK